MVTHLVITVIPFHLPETALIIHLMAFALLIHLVTVAQLTLSEVTVMGINLVIVAQATH